MQKWTDRLLLLLLPLVLLLAACAPSQEPPEPPVSQPEEWQVDETSLTDDYLISLVIGMETALPRTGSFTFSDPTELTTDQLHSYFLLLTREDECTQFLPPGAYTFYIPEEFILSKLSAYFKEFRFDFTASNGYDPDSNRIVVQRFSFAQPGPDMRILSKSLDGNIVTFTGGFYQANHPEQGLYLTKTYTIEFYDGGYYYLSAVVSDPPPEEPWRVDPATLTDDYLISLVGDMERALPCVGSFTFSDPAELTTDQLYSYFLLLTSKDECAPFLSPGATTFHIPEAFILSRLSAYFKEFHFDITAHSDYIPTTNSIATWSIPGFRGGPSMRMLSKSIDGGIVTFTAGFYNDGHPEQGLYLTKTYSIEFYEGGYYYLSAVVSDPPPEEPWRVDEAMLTDDYLISLVIGMEVGLVGDNEFTFNDPTELSSNELYLCFLLLTSHDECSQFLRKGVWRGMETDLFYLPEEFMVTRLSAYFKEFYFDITQLYGYDPETNCVVTQTVTGFGGGPDMDILSKSIDGNTVTFTGGLYWYQEARDAAVRPYFAKKTYTIEFYDGGYYYLSAVIDDTPDPSPVNWSLEEEDDGPGLVFTGPLPAGQRGPDGRLVYPWSDLRERIVRIELKEDITDIPEEAFRDFAALEDVEYPDTLRSIGPRAFAGCICYDAVLSFPDNLETIGEGAFSHCITLWSAALPASLTTLAPDVFADCVSLRELSLPEGLTALEDGCLRGCSSLGTLTIPAGVTYVGEIPVKVLIFRGEPPRIAQENGAYLLEDYTSLYYPEGSAAWAALAAGCRQEKLFWVEGPTAVTWDFDESTGTLTFSGVGALTADEVDANGPYRPYDWTYLEETATALVLEEGITRIPDRSFYGFSSVTSVSLPSSLRSIGSFGLADCAFEELLLPEKLEAIDSFAFTFCRQLRRCEIPAGVHAVLGYVFQECISLHTLTLHEGVRVLEEEYLRACDSMHELTIPNGVEFVGHSGASTGLDVITFLGDPPRMIAPLAYANHAMYYPENSAAWRKTIEKFYQDHPDWNNTVWIEGLPESAE